MRKGVLFATIGNEIMVDSRKEFALSQFRRYAVLGYRFSNLTHFQFVYMDISHPLAPGLHKLQFFLAQRFSFKV